MSDFDVDKFMANKRKPAKTTAPVKDQAFDVDAFMQKRQKPQPARADADPFDLTGAAVERARAEREARASHITGNLRTGAASGYQAATSPIDTAADVVTGLLTGDTRPARELGKRLALGVAGFAGPPGSAPAVDAAVGEVAGQTAARRLNEGDIQFLERQSRQSRIAKEEAKDPSLTGRLTRGVVSGAVQSLPYIAASPGGAPALGLVGALSSLDQPENLVLNTAMAAAPLPAVGPLLRRLRGRTTRTTAPQVTRNTARTPAISTQPDAPTTSRLQFPDAPPTSRMPAISQRIAAENAPTAALPQANEFAPSFALESAPAKDFAVKLAKERGGSAWRSGPRQEIELGFKTPPTPQPKAREWPSSGRAVGGAFRTAAQALRTFKTAFDLSAPMNQGAVLTRAHPIKGAQAFGRMLRSLSPKQSKAIDDEIINHPLRSLGDEFDLYIATGGAPEEAFMLKALNKVPGIGASERTYRTYLDSLRLSTWESYVKSLQAAGHTPQSNPMAYKQAAQFINIATGRGSLKPGGRFDLAMTLGGDVLFAPRNLISKFQLLDPVRYMTLAPGARKIVLRDAMTSFGALIGTASLLTAAGARVGWNPERDDFLTARWGNHRYDLTGGLKTEVRFLARMSAGAYRQAEGEGVLPGQDPLSVASSWARGKLSPGAGLVFDALKGSDFKGQKFSEKTKTQIAVETVAPMIVEEFYDAHKESGVPGVLKSSPAFFGQRVSAYPDRAKAAWLDEPKGWRDEQIAAGDKRMFIEPRRAKDKSEQDETPAEFEARKNRVNDLLGRYATKMIDSKSYQSATTEEKAAMREYLRRAIGRADLNVELLDPGRILEVVRESAYQKREKERAAKLSQ